MVSTVLQMVSTVLRWTELVCNSWHRHSIHKNYRKRLVTVASASNSPPLTTMQTHTSNKTAHPGLPDLPLPCKLSEQVELESQAHEAGKKVVQATKAAKVKELQMLEDLGSTLEKENRFVFSLAAAVTGQQRKDQSKVN